MKQRLGIYIHIPFCASKCGYCDFYSLAGCDHLMPDYNQALIKHIEESEDVIKNYQVDTIYFGGGTPSYYGADRIVEILNTLKLNGNVRLDSEITVECNPDSISPAAMQFLREEGVNRLSLGVQASDNGLLKLIGRRHNFQQAVRAISEARKAGFDNVSVDLMFGLPSQTKKDWTDTLYRILELHPEHISCYGLQLEEGTRMYNEYRDSPILPDSDEQADMYSFAAELLTGYRYQQYEISNFAAPGFRCRHNMKYWRLDDYIGFGPGAASCVGNLRYSFVKDLRRYIAGVERGISMTDECERIVPLEKAVEYLMLAMRTSDGISERDYRQKCLCDWKPIHQALQAFAKKGWAECTEGRWHFTVPGFLLSNTLIGVLLEAQTSGRVEWTPWLLDAFMDEKHDITLPKGEDEFFREMYEEKIKS